MFVVTDADAAAIRAVYQQRGELSAALELRRRFPGITDNAQARMWARTIAGWKPLLPALPLRRVDVHHPQMRIVGGDVRDELCPGQCRLRVAGTIGSVPARARRSHWARLRPMLAAASSWAGW
jgi:hypothetical protein